MFRKVLFCHLIILSVFLLISCEEDKVTDPTDPVEWPDRTEKEDCVTIMEMVYRHREIEKYEDLLLEPDTSGVFPEGFMWLSHSEDIIDENCWGYYQEVTLTDSILTHALELELDLSSEGDWDTLETFREQPCSGCWQTIRDYYLHVVLDNGTDYITDSFIRLVIGPDPADPARFLIYQQEEMRQGVQGQVGDTGEEKWGYIKSLFLLNDSDKRSKS